jgi:glycosyltransferase involved in cell wall biosynthesis
MKLLIASVDFLPKIGGISMSAHHLANACVEAGLDVTVLSPTSGVIPPGISQNYSHIHDEAAQPHLREGPLWASQERPALEHRLREVWNEGKFDRALAWHSFYYGPALLSVARERMRPLSVMTHGFELKSQMLLRQKWRSFRMRHNGHAPSLSDETLKCVRNTDQALANSRFTASLISRTGRRGAAKIIGCGISPKMFEGMKTDQSEGRSELRRRAREKFGFSDSDFVLGTLCRLVPSKNVCDLIKSLPHLPNAKALILGTGPEQAALQNLATDLGVHERVVFAGAIEEQDKPAALSSMDVFCLLSRPGQNGEVEGFGIALLEAAACGTPVITTGTGGMVDIVDHGVTGFHVKVGNSKMLADTAASISSNKSDSEQMTRQLQELIRTRYNWNTIANNLIASWA